MSASSGGKHRAQRAQPRPRLTGVPPRHRAGAGRPASGPSSPAVRAGALSVGLVVVTGAGIIAVAPPAAADTSATVGYRVALVDSSTPVIAADTASTPPTFDSSLAALLDMLGVGDKTPAQLFDNGETVGQLLGGSSTSTVTVDTGLNLQSTMDLLGLQNITIGQVMNALSLPPTDTVDQALSQMQFLNTKLDMLLTPLGLPSTQTLLGVEEKFGVDNITIDELLPKLGFSGSETFQQVENFWGIPSNFQSLMSLGFGFISCAPGKASVNWSIDELIQCVSWKAPDGTAETMHGDDQLGWVLQNDTMPDGRPLADYTLGEALNFNSHTTIRQFIDNLHVNLSNEYVGPDAPAGDPSVPDLTNLPTLGNVSLAQLLSWANMPATEDLATFVSHLQVGGTDLGDYTIGDALDGLIVDPAALSTATVQDTTPVEDLLNAMGWGTYTIDEMLNLTP